MKNNRLHISIALRRLQGLCRVALCGSKFFILFLLCSCEYKDLCYDHNHGDSHGLELKLNLKLDLDLNLEVSEEAHTKILTPEYMKVCLYHPETGALMHTEFVGTYGGPLHAVPGTYDLVVYSFGTEWTQVRGESSAGTLEAFTSDITAQKAGQMASFTRNSDYEAPGPIIYTPDHLLSTRMHVEVPPFSGEERVVTITAMASTIVDTYGFEVTNVTGIEYIASAEAFVTNQARSCFFGRGVPSVEPATIYFPVEVDLSTRSLRTTFNTFGKLPGDSHTYLHIVLRDTGGTEHTFTEDITPQFEEPDHDIVIDDEIVIPQPESGGGGIAPTVDPWENENHDVPIG